MQAWDGKTERREHNSLLEKRVEEIHRILVGNGKIGLCSKVDIMWYTTIFIVSGISVTIGAYLWRILILQ